MRELIATQHFWIAVALPLLVSLLMLHRHGRDIDGSFHMLPW